MESARMMWVLADPYHQGIKASSYEDRGHPYFDAGHTQAIYSFFQSPIERLGITTKADHT
jgi:hypothetical protein